ncbi:hypothetical protein [Streptomyces sp. ST1020]|uniref:hypothetical protein n=1 Tax=Streptomyces sp. ST1020 TaxID=1848901 RepID=UPI0034C6CC9E
MRLGVEEVGRGLVGQGAQEDRGEVGGDAVGGCLASGGEEGGEGGAAQDEGEDVEGVAVEVLDVVGGEEEAAGAGAGGSW